LANKVGEQKVIRRETERSSNANWQSWGARK